MHSDAVPDGLQRPGVVRLRRHDPRLPDDLSVWIKRVPRDAAHISKLETAVIEFLAEVDAKMDALTKLRVAA